MGYEENLGPAGPSDAPGLESLEQVIEAYQTQAMDGHSSDFSGIPSTNSNPWAPESFSPEMEEASQTEMSPYGAFEMQDDPYQMPDPYEAAQQIFDEQMQFMADPFLPPDMLAPPGMMPGF